MYLSISDITVTVALSQDSPVLGATYFPRTPTKNNDTFQRVTETVEVNLRGTHTTIRNTVNAIEKLLEQAARRKKTGEDRVFAFYKPVDGDTYTYRSEIVEGRVEWSTEPGLRRLGDGTTPTARVAVIWTREHWWEGAEAELELSAFGQSAATNGKTIYNDPADNTSTHGNWVQVAAAQLTGTLPTPVKLEMTNTSGGPLVYSKLFLSVNAFSNPANFTHWLQAENDLDGTSENVVGSASGGKTITFPQPTTTTWKWTLPATDLQKTAGKKARILARFDGLNGTELYITPAIRDAAGTAVLWTGDELSHGDTVVSGGLWCDLGVVPLPPGGYSTPSAALTLALTLRGTATAYLDVIQLTMVDSYRYLAIAPTSIANNAAIVHDGTENLTYILSSALRTPLVTSYGGPLELYPGVINRIHILHELSSTAPIADTTSVKAYYRPRRVTV